jgi:hypothetical protein
MITTRRQSASTLGSARGRFDGRRYAALISRRTTNPRRRRDSPKPAILKADGPRILRYPDLRDVDAAGAARHEHAGTLIGVRLWPAPGHVAVADVLEGGGGRLR